MMGSSPPSDLEPGMTPGAAVATEWGAGADTSGNSVARLLSGEGGFWHCIVGEAQGKGSVQSWGTGICLEISCIVPQ